MNILLTGFPGFLATELTKQILHDHEVQTLYFLVEKRFLSKATQVLHDIETTSPRIRNKWKLLEGDITKPLINHEELVHYKDTITHVFHLAAIYDLAVPEKIAYDVNVVGTRHVNEFVLHCSNLQRYTYFSTAYVAGKRNGIIYENELAMGQTFKNHYESTKYEAEILVSELKEKVPVTIIRPGVVRGHSITGETTKFDGPYFFLSFFDFFRFSPIIPYLGKGAAKGNFVPLDYVLKATSYLALSDKGKNKTYHLTDPNPYSMKEIYGMICEKHLGRKPLITLPLGLAKIIMTPKWIQKWMKVEREALDYFETNSLFDSSQAQKDLTGSGIACADFKETLPAFVTYYQTHRHDQEKRLPQFRRK